VLRARRRLRTSSVLVAVDLHLSERCLRPLDTHEIYPPPLLCTWANGSERDASRPRETAHNPEVAGSNLAPAVKKPWKL
jgi:hypothetical protein